MGQLSQSGKAPTTIGSVEKALSILDTFARERRPMGVTDVSKTLNLNFSTTHHLVSTLVLKGYLEQDQVSRKYRLGLRALQLGLAAEESFTLVDRARPVLRDLASRVNEAVNLAVFDRGEAVYVEQASGVRTLTMFTRLGARVPLHCTGVGKVYLAHLKPAEARALLDAQGWTKFTNHTLTEWYLMERELSGIRENGYAIDHEEREEGVACVAVPVKNAPGHVIAAISVSGPSGRILPRLKDLTLEAIAAGLELSQGIGYSGK